MPEELSHLPGDGPVIRSVSLPPVSLNEEAADGVIAVLKENGFAGFRVGGSVRDRLLGRSSNDVDVATDAVPATIKALFSRSFSVGENFGVVVVHTPEGVDIEVATFRADGEYADGRRPAHVHFSDIRTDAFRRDFTINALFYDPVEQQLQDFTGGLTDLHKGILRAIGTPAKRFEEDRLRMLRAVRFATSLQFQLDPDTAEAIRRHAEAIFDVSPERILVELNKMLTGPAPHKAMAMLSDVGLLRHILPEVEAMKGVEQPPEFHPEGDVWMHTMLMLENMRWPSVELAWSVLLHDVGKPPTQTYDGKRYRFNGHPAASARMAEDILKRLRSSRRLRETVCGCVGSHMKFMHVQEMRRSTFRRFAGGENFACDLELHRLDCTGSHSMLDHYCFVLDQLSTLAAEPAIPAPLLTGKDLIAMGMKPGKRMGTLLRKIQEEQLEGRLNSREDAVKYAIGKL